MVAATLIIFSTAFFSLFKIDVKFLITMSNEIIAVILDFYNKWDSFNCPSEPNHITTITERMPRLLSCSTLLQ